MFIHSVILFSLVDVWIAGGFSLKRLVNLQSNRIANKYPILKYSDYVQVASSLEEMNQILDVASPKGVVVFRPESMEKVALLTSAALLLDHSAFKLFDYEMSFSKLNASNTTPTAIFEKLAPSYWLNNSAKEIDLASSRLLCDMMELIRVISQGAPSNSIITCRLCLSNTVRCPKWHEDYVLYRLIKCYYGKGTDWTDPGDYLLRIYSFFRRTLGLELFVPLNRVQNTDTADVLVIAGRDNVGRNGCIAPVLHRSPLGDGNEQRMIFSVTVEIPKEKK